MLTKSMNETFVEEMEIASSSESMEVMNMEAALVATMAVSDQDTVVFACCGTLGTLGTAGGCIGTLGTLGCAG